VPPERSGVSMLTWWEADMVGTMREIARFADV
jgi:hypothetical protein